MENLEKYHNRFVVDGWVHNNGFTQRWLRRISRTTDTQLVSDVQYTLILGGKHYEKDSYLYARSKSVAKRYNIKNGGLFERRERRWGDDGVSTATFFEKNSDIECVNTFEEIFETDLRDIYPDKKSRMRDKLDFSYDNWSDAIKDKEKLERNTYFPTLRPVDESTHFGSVVKYLKDLFNVPVFQLKIGFLDSIDTTHERSTIMDNAVHMHINHNGNEKEVLTMEESQNNLTISFWLFKDKVVFQTEGGITSW